MSLLNKLAKASTVKHASVLSDSKFFGSKDMTTTDLPILNLAFSGSLKGGFKSGLTQFAGPSRHFKSNLALFCVKAYMEKYKDAVCLYYDSEFGSPPAYLEAFGIDLSRVLHTPVIHVEQLKFDLVAQLDNIERGDKVIIFIDSIGNLASKKETEDALEQKSVADMSRAKAIKSLFRIVTPQLTVKDLTCIAINHTIQTMEMFSKTVVTGGTGIMYSSDNVFIMGRAQEKDGTDLAGYNFTINIDKSRYVREKSKFPLNVTFVSGINKYSGMLDLAQELDFVIKPKNGWYARVIVDENTGEIIPDKSWRAKDTNCAEFWDPLLNSPAFELACNKRFQLGGFAHDSTEDEVDVHDNADDDV